MSSGRRYSIRERQRERRVTLELVPDVETVEVAYAILRGRDRGRTIEAEAAEGRRRRKHERRALELVPSAEMLELTYEILLDPELVARSMPRLATKANLAASLGDGNDEL